jgi:nucleotide-binding universal stress UspA family protein
MTAAPVLCAVDFSKDSRAALLWAARYAEREDARLVVLHVVHDPASSPGFYREPEAGWLRPMEEVAKEMFDEFLHDVREQNPKEVGLGRIETMLRAGLPAGRIAEAADEIGAGLVVVGSRGRTGLPHILLGSVAQRVAQIAAAPVTVVKAPEAPEP